MSCRRCLILASSASASLPVPPAGYYLTLLSLALVRDVNSKVQIIIPLRRLSIHTSSILPYCRATYPKFSSSQSNNSLLSQAKSKSERQSPE